jgi:hypothetical protein
MVLPMSFSNSPHYDELNKFNRIKEGGNSKWQELKIKGERLAVDMENPFYFNLPLRKRLEFLNFSSQQAIYHRICAYNEHLSNEPSGSKHRFDKSEMSEDSQD